MITTEQIQEIVGAKVFDPTGEKIGSVGQVYLDDADGHPAWVAVRTGMFGTNENFVPLDRDARLSDGKLTVSTSKEKVKDAPQVEPESGHLSEMSAAELYRYYNMPFSGQRGGDLDTEGRMKAASGNVGTRAGDLSAVGERGRNLNLTRYEEQLRVGKQQVESGRVRLRKHVVTEDVTTTVPVSHEEVRLEREPITGTTKREAGRHEFADEDTEVVLHEERVVVNKETVPVERVGLVKETRTEQQPVSGTVRKEEIEVEDERDTKRRRS